MPALQQNPISGTRPPTSMKRFSRVRIGRVWVDRLSLADLLDDISSALETGSPRTFFYANAHGITSAKDNDALAKAFASAHAVFCDGFGVYLASRFLGAPVPERFAWPDWIDRLAKVCV